MCEHCERVVAYLPQRVKSTFFEKIFFTPGLLWAGTLHTKNFQKTLIYVFEVIVQLPKHTFEIRIFFHFLAHCGTKWRGKGRKLEEAVGIL